MLCSETGSQEAVRLEHLTCRDAKKINDLFGAIDAYNGGYGSIELKREKGVITVIDWMMRWFRPKGDC